MEEYCHLPAEMLGNGDFVALNPKGNGLTGDDIQGDDVLIVKKQRQAQNGQRVVAFVDGDITVGTLFYRQNGIELRPGNRHLPPRFVDATGRFELYGVVIGLYRKL